MNYETREDTFTSTNTVLCLDSVGLHRACTFAYGHPAVYTARIGMIKN